MDTRLIDQLIKTRNIRITAYLPHTHTYICATSDEARKLVQLIRTYTGYRAVQNTGNRTNSLTVY